MNLSLAHALRISAPSSIAFIGAGGKTTTIFKLARELSQPVIVTATTHLGSWQAEFADKHIITETPAAIEKLEHGLKGVILITGKKDGNRINPVNDDLLNWLNQFCGYHSIPLLMEADGSRQKPLKGWADHEPPIPNFIDVVVQVVGMSGLGKSLTEEFVHRPDTFSRLSDLQTGEIVTSEAVIKVLSHPENGMRNAPASARKILLLNQADEAETQAVARSMIPALLPSYDAVVIASHLREIIYAVHERIAGIVLAAGGSERFGMSKQMLEWKGQPFVRVVAQTAITAGLSPVIVVTGSNAEQVEAAVQGLGVKIVRNMSWEKGQGSSIREGILSITPAPLPLGEGHGGCIFLLTDQPQVSASIIHALKEKHAEGLHPIVAPMVMDRRGNPVLFDRVTFPDLLSLEGDIGGRGIFHKHKVEYIPWHDDSLLMDVDTPEQYEQLVSNKDL